MRIGFFGLLILLVGLQGRAAVYLSPLTGKDHRTEMRFQKMPWTTIGQVITHYKGTRRRCTGTLVGHHIMVTAAHCVVKNNTKLDVTFYPNVIEGKSLNEAHSLSTQFVVGTMDPEKYPKRDWAVVYLDKDLGSYYGYMGYFQPGRVIPGETVYFAGYSTDFPRQEIDIKGNEKDCFIPPKGSHIDPKSKLLDEVESPEPSSGKCFSKSKMTQTASFEQCEIKKIFDEYGFYGHSCSGMGGASGGPLFGKEGKNFFILAMHTRGNDHYYRGYADDSLHNPNRAVWSVDLVRTIDYFRKNYDSADQKTSPKNPPR